MQSVSGFELVSPCPFPTTITSTPRAPPVVDKSKLGAFSNVCFESVGTPAAHVFTASGHMKKCYGGGWSEVEFIFCADTILYPGVRHPYFLSGALGISAFLELILFYFSYRYKFPKLKLLSRWVLVLRYDKWKKTKVQALDIEVHSFLFPQTLSIKFVQTIKYVVVVVVVYCKCLSLLYTEISSDLLINSKLTHKQNQSINKQIKHHERIFQEPDVV